MYDVIVAGLGGMGSAAAYQLAGRGKRVLGLERYSPAHDRGSSHGQSRIIRQAYFEGPAYVPLLLRAYELWEQLEGETGEDLMTLTGGLMIGPPGSELFEGSKRERRGARPALRGARRRRTEAPLPGLRTDPDTVALFEEKAGFVRPEASVKAHLDRAASLGADLRFGEATPILGADAVSGCGSRRHRAPTRRSGWSVSAGAWAPKLLADLGPPARGYAPDPVLVRPEGRHRALPPRPLPHLYLGARGRQHVLRHPGPGRTEAGSRSRSSGPTACRPTPTR